MSCISDIREIGRRRRLDLFGRVVVRLQQEVSATSGLFQFFVLQVNDDTSSSWLASSMW